MGTNLQGTGELPRQVSELLPGYHPISDEDNRRLPMREAAEQLGLSHAPSAVEANGSDDGESHYRSNVAKALARSRNCDHATHR